MAAIAALLLAQASAALPPSSSTAAPDPKVAAIGERGRMLYAYDQDAWHGTDDSLAHHRDLIPKRGGYVVDGPVDAARLVFFDADSQRTLYIAHVSGGRIVDAVVPAGDAAVLSPLDRRLAAAREAATAAVRADPAARPCAAKPFNTVVVPNASDGTISVYFLTPQTSVAAIPMGGHYRVDVDAAGKAGTVRRFTNTCLTTPVNGAPRGGTPLAAFVTQVIGDRPTEIHVFASLTLRRPVYVGTRDTEGAHLWIVDGARIDGPRPLPAR